MLMKRFSWKIRDFISSPKAGLVGNTLMVVLFFVLAIVFSQRSIADATSDNLILDIVANVFANGVAISVILVEIAAFLVRKVIDWADTKLEESDKTSDDHHGIVHFYSGHAKAAKIEKDKNYFSRVGNYLTINRLRDTSLPRKWAEKYYLGSIRQPHADVHSSVYQNTTHDLDMFYDTESEGLAIPSVNIFANLEGNVKIKFMDSSDVFPLPSFVINNSKLLMEAHRTSNTDNVETIRMNDLSYIDTTKTLTIHTGRTCYNNMLLTNRCMDYEFAPKLSLRQVYEYRDTVLPLDKTVLGNQIGIEGLVITTDGWTLIEKRRNNQRTTWRNKYSQPISLSMKKSAMKLSGADDTIPATTAEANDRIRNMISKFLFGNFGLSIDEDYSFETEKNFMGIARDLLEGGKPNMYFYVVVNMDHKQLKQKLEGIYTDPSSDKKRPDISANNLQRRFYLYELEKAKVDFNYIMNMKLNKCERLYRIRPYEKKYHKPLANLIMRMVCMRDQIKMKYRRVFENNYRKECGEAFLGCLAYYELCKDRINEERQRLAADNQA